MLQIPTGVVPRIEFKPQWTHCAICGKKLKVLKTTHKRVVTLRYGMFTAHETILYCKDHKYLPADANHEWNRIRAIRSQELLELVKLRRRFGHDVTVYIGRQRFVKYRTEAEIIDRLLRKYCIQISTGEVSYLSKQFLILLKCLHDLNDDQMQAMIARQGGYILHIDGTSAEDSDHIFTALDGISGHVLLSSKILSENKNELVELFKELKARFNEPLVILKDMAKGVENACKEVFPDVPIVECHFHFARDVGRELFKPYYTEFRELMATLQIRTKLKRILKDIQSISLQCEYPLKDILRAIDAGDTVQYDDEGLMLALLYDNVQKTLKYQRDRSGIGYPFDLPLVELYHNCLKSAPLIHQLLVTYAETNTTHSILHRLDRLLRGLAEPSTVNLLRLRTLDRKLTEVWTLFSELRTVLRLRCNGMTPLSAHLVAPLCEHRSIIADLKSFQTALNKELNGDDCPLRREKQVIYDHLVRHLTKLELPVIEILHEDAVWCLMIPRTNNLSEQLFRHIKRSRRRAHGRSDVGRDLNEYGPYLCYVENLRHPDYLASLCGCWKGMSRAFSMISPSVYADAEREYDSLLKTPIRPFRLDKGFEYLFNRGLAQLDFQIALRKYGGGLEYRPMSSATDV